MAVSPGPMGLGSSGMADKKRKKKHGHYLSCFMIIEIKPHPNERDDQNCHHSPGMCLFVFSKMNGV